MRILQLLVVGLLAVIAGCDAIVDRTAVGPVIVAGAATAADSKSTAKSNSPESTALKYPDARQADQTDEYKIKVADPYRWLEDPDSPETRAWIEAENKLTFATLEKIPQREALGKRLTKLWDYEKFGVPTQRGGRLFYSRNDGLQNQNVLVVADSVAANGPQVEARVLLDPNTLSKDGTVALAGYEISDDGKLLAYGIATAGSDWQEWRCRDVATATDRDDLLKWVKFSGAAWTSDNAGFYYSRYDEPTEAAKLTGVNYYQKLYYHKVGTPQSEDRLTYERTDEKEWGFHGEVSEDGKYLVITVTHGTERKNQLFYLDLTDPNATVVELIQGFTAQYIFLGNEGSTFWLQTDQDAPAKRVIAVDTARPNPADWREMIPEQKDTLETVHIVGDGFFAVYLKDAQTMVRRFDLTGKATGDVTLPGVGTAAGFTGRRADQETFYSFTGFTTPPTIYKLDIKSGERAIFRQPKVDFKPSDYEVRQVFYNSKDGTRVPMFIVHKNGLKLDGRNPTLLYGYGGFNIPLTPAFSIGRLVWLEMGGVYAVPSLRGGGEYGRSWHEAGMKKQKQKVFDDFIAAAEFLIREKYTSSDKLAISGRSNGGLLVGACLTQRPELYGAALPGVGVMDMLRYHKFTIGWAWVSEYGSADDPDMLPTLLEYSPLHNIRPGTKYPATLVTTADHDDRVVPAHSFKFAATLQAAQAGSAPILIRIETSAGHGAGTPTSKQIEEVADTYAFLIDALQIDVPKTLFEK